MALFRFLRFGIREERADPLEEPLPFGGHMDVFQFSELAEQLLVSFFELDGDLDESPHQQVASLVTLWVWYPLPCQAEDVAGRGSGGDLQAGRAIHRGDLHLGSEYGLGIREGHLQIQIQSVAFEQRVFSDVDNAVAIPGWSPVEAAFSFALNEDLHPLIDAGGDPDLAVDGFGLQTAPAAIGARIGHDATAPAAIRTGGLHSEDTGGLDDLSSTSALGTGRRLTPGP